MIPSIEKQHAFVRGVTSRRKEAEAGSEDAEDNWGFEGMVSGDMVAASRARDKLKEILQLCEDGEEAVPKSVVEVIELSWKVVDTKHNNAKLSDRTTDLESEMENVRSLEQLVHINLETASERVKTWSFK